jgi:hypothetical protein
MALIADGCDDDENAMTHSASSHHRPSRRSRSKQIYLSPYDLLETMSFSLCFLLAFITLHVSSCDAWVMPAGGKSTATRQTASTSSHLGMAVGNKHGENACFLPLEQLDQDYYAPRIVQVSTSAVNVHYCLTVVGSTSLSHTQLLCRLLEHILV